MTKFERISKRLRAECGVQIPPETKLHRTYAGREQKSRGGWVWFVLTEDGREIGSQISVTDLLKADKLDVHTDENNSISIYVK